MRRAALLLASAMALTGGHAMAGVVVSVTDVELADNKPTATTVYLDNDRMKVVNGNDTMIYRGDLKRMWTIDANDHTYTEITPDTIQQMKGQLAQAQSQAQQRFANMSPEQRAQMEAAMAQLPPEQRARMQAMMGGAGGGPGGPPAAPPAEKINYVKAGGGKSVGSWRCDSYAKTVNGKKEEDLCIAPIGAVGLNQGDFKVLDSVSGMFGDLSGQAARRNDYMGLDAMNKAIGFQGVPLETISYSSDGKPERRNTVNKIDRTNIPASTFDLPPGFTKKEMNFGRPPR